MSARVANGKLTTMPQLYLMHPRREMISRNLKGQLDPQSKIGLIQAAATRQNAKNASNWTLHS
jgi:hypothetical protein